MPTKVDLSQKEYEAALARGHAAPRARSIAYFPRKRLFQMELANRTTLLFSVELFPELSGAKAREIGSARLMFGGTDIWWDDLDVQHTVEYLAAKAIQVTTAREAARKAASSRSPRKTAASRENGKLGGRPRKVHGHANS